MTQKICSQCKKEFIYTDVTKKRIFCSKNCYQKNYKQKYKKKPLQFKNCETCNKEFSTRISFRKYCSIKCRSRSTVAQNNWKRNNEKKKRIVKIVVCIVCNKEFLPKQNGAKYCSKKCYNRSDKVKSIERERNKTRIQKKYSEWSDKRKQSKINYQKNRKKIDPVYKIIANMRTRLGMFLSAKNFKKTNSTFAMVGCSPKFLKEHLEKKFEPGMTWNNHSIDGWHIDHIIPLDRAKNEEDIKKLCHYTNLQPLWAEENLKKSNK